MESTTQEFTMNEQTFFPVLKVTYFPKMTVFLKNIKSFRNKNLNTKTESRGVCY